MDSRLAPPSDNAHHMTTRSKNGIYKPKALQAVSDLHQREPYSDHEALTSPHWVDAMKKELQALHKNHTWSLTTLPANRTVVGSKWIFKIKRRADGSIARYKARLVAKGFHQTPGFDFDETFSPVVKQATIWVVLTIALANRWPLRQLDVDNAFLHGILVAEVYLQQPPGFSTIHQPPLVCHLHKALYGLKQAPRAWFARLSASLLSFGFTHSKADTSLFFRFRPKSTIFILVYVDNIIITDNNNDELVALVGLLGQEFSLKDLGELNYFLGIQAIRRGSDLILSQEQYISDH